MGAACGGARVRTRRRRRPWSASRIRGSVLSDARTGKQALEGGVGFFEMAGAGFALSEVEKIEAEIALGPSPAGPSECSRRNSTRAPRAR